VCRLNYAGVPNIERMMAMFRTALESHRSRIDGGGNRAADAPGKRP
jgi:hypothetical protein